MEAGDTLEIRVRGDEGEATHQRRGSNQGVDVADESWATGRAELSAKVSVALEDWVGQEVRVHTIEECS
jgi:hypothetical protein